MIICIASMLWAWSQGYYWYSKVCFLPWPSHWLKSSLQKFYGRHHNLVDRYEISISQITMHLLVDVFLSLSLSILLPELTVYMSNTAGVRSKNYLPFTSIWVQPRFLVVESVLLIYFSFLCCPIMCLYVLSSVLWCPLRFPHKNNVRFVFTSSCI